MTSPKRSKATKAVPKKSADRLYYETLSFSNLKCFAGDHLIDFRGDGERPSLWTLFLGENGVGKTSILQMLAWMRPVEPPENKKTIEPAIFGEPDNLLFLKLVRQAETASKMVVRATFGGPDGSGGKPTQTNLQVATNEGDPYTDGIAKLADVSLGHGRNTAKPSPQLPLIGYGANRQIGSKNLGDPVLSDPVEMLFSPVTTLYDPESILRDLDYAMRMRKKGAAARRTQFLELIATIAPAIGEVSNIRFTGPSIKADGADLTGIKFQTRSGLVPFPEMSRSLSEEYAREEPCRYPPCARPGAR